MKDFAYVCNILKTKKKERKEPEIVVHIQLCIFLCLILYFFSKSHEHNTWGGKLFVVKEIKTV